ncbi:hypothetical protein G6F57_016473 [Rhizopus arrhizus]|nr:hypothetical protein G6F57_016473 [Rhizopus arrhizus]
MPAAISPSVLKRAIAASRACSCWRRASARERCQAAAPAISKALATAHASQAVQGQASGVNVRVLRIWKGWLAAPSGFCSVIVKPGASSGCLSSSGSAVWSTVRLRLARPGGKSAAGTNWRASSSRLQLDGEINQYRAGSSGKTTGRPNWRARSSASDRPGGAARLPAQAPRGRVRQGRQRGQHGFVLDRLLAQHALGDAGALEEAVVLVDVFLAGDPGGAQAEQDEPAEEGARAR